MHSLPRHQYGLFLFGCQLSGRFVQIAVMPDLMAFRMNAGADVRVCVKGMSRREPRRANVVLVQQIQNARRGNRPELAARNEA